MYAGNIILGSQGKVCLNDGKIILTNTPYRLKVNGASFFQWEQEIIGTKVTLSKNGRYKNYWAIGSPTHKGAVPSAMNEDRSWTTNITYSAYPYATFGSTSLATTHRDYPADHREYKCYCSGYYYDKLVGYDCAASSETYSSVLDFGACITNGDRMSLKVGDTVKTRDPLLWKACKVLVEVPVSFVASTHTDYYAELSYEHGPWHDDQPPVEQDGTVWGDSFDCVREMIARKTETFGATIRYEIDIRRNATGELYISSVTNPSGYGARNVEAAASSEAWSGGILGNTIRTQMNVTSPSFSLVRAE